MFDWYRMNTDNIEEAILITFLFAHELELEFKDVFTLDADVFTTEYKKSIVKNINSHKSEYYSVLSLILEEKAMNTEYEYEFLNILSQTPLTFDLANKYHLQLQNKLKLRSII